MIDYNTIVSTTQDKITLLQWLKKVEAALKDASATTFKVNKKGNATLTFSIEFADGSELESGEIVLQQGESVESGAIVNGHLMLTLSNGDVLDCGELLNGNLNVNGDLSVSGNIYGVKLEHIKDNAGNNRFIEGDINLDASMPAGVTKTYGKWSLSGTHLMLVLVLSLANATELTNGDIVATAFVPTWLHDKIFKLWSTNAVDRKTFVSWSDTWNTQQVNIIMSKESGNRLRFINGANLTMTEDRNVRIQFDLLIDNA